MNSSSGIKRGLAATAVAALAVTGIPALASSASATAGETLAVVSVGATLNGGDQGGLIRLKTNAPSTDFDGTTGELALANPNLNAGPDNGNQSIDIIDTAATVEYIPSGTVGQDSLPNDGLSEVLVNVAATTSDTGATATYALFIDEDVPGAPVDGDVDAGEARAQVSQQTSGALASIDVTPATQSAPQNIDSGAYSLTLKDSAGRTTQLMAAEDVDIDASDVSVTPSVASFTAEDLELGTGSFTAEGTTVGSYTITADATTTPDVTKTVAFNVTAAATITPADVDIVTNADSWDGPNDGGAGNFATDTLVRVDQGSITIAFNGGIADANSTVSLNIDGNGQMTFGGADTTTASTVLDANGVGSIVITPDPFTVQDGDVLSITGSFIHDIEFDRAAPQTTAPSGVYFSQLDSSVDVTATFTDQFGLPITTGFVSAFRTGANADTPPGQVKPIGADGTATFTFTDEDGVLNTTEGVTFWYLEDQFSPGPSATSGTSIKYTADGMGSNFKTRFDGDDTEAADYLASDQSVLPLYDTVANGADEALNLTVENGENGSAITVTVDNGALILEPGETLLSEGSASITDEVVGGVLPAGYQVIGTESGVITATIESANRTETAQFTVEAQTDWSSQRNVTVSGPAEVESGATQIQFVAVVTDAFGNPVPGVTPDDLNIQVTGPAVFQDSDAMTDAMGQLHLNVRVDSDAEGDVGIQVTGLYGQMGAEADRLTRTSNTDDGKGLTVSSNVGSAVTTVTAPPAPEGIALKLNGKNNGKKADKLKANANDNGAGLVAKLFRGGKKIASHKLNDSGNWTFTVKDKNGNKKTKYTVKVAATDTTKAGQASKTVK